MGNTATVYKEGENEAVDEVLSGGSLLIRRFRDVAETALEGVRTRIHGDYHLGQVLVLEGGDFLLIDFEGEPLRSIRERRDKYSPLKDVAGMLRSFGYAAHSAFADAVAARPDLAATRDPWLPAWESWISATFLRAYLESAEHGALLPGDATHVEKLLQAFLLDKAFYELGYELNNRPDWVSIPLEGIRSLMNRGDDPGKDDR